MLYNLLADWAQAALGKRTKVAAGTAKYRTEAVTKPVAHDVRLRFMQLQAR
jgi:hypothetical protein